MEHAHSSDKRQSTPSVFTQQEGRRLQILRWVLNLVFDAWTMVQRWLLLKDQYDSSVSENVQWYFSNNDCFAILYSGEVQK